MKQILQILLILFFIAPIYGQVDDIESVMTRRHLSCQDIRFNVQYLIPKFYENNSKDSLHATIRFWEKLCGISEKSTRCKILLAIDERNFSESIYDYTILNYVVEYKNRSIQKGNYYGHNYIAYSNTPDTLNQFTVDLANKLLKRNDLKAIEKFYLRIYSNDFENTFTMLQTDEFNGTIIQDMYYKEVELYIKQVVLHVDFMGGVWIPQDNLATVGSHPFFGFRAGVRYEDIIADVVLGFKFGKSPNVYQIHARDSIWDTDRFFGAYFGFDFGLEMHRINNSSFDLIGGIAYDGFDALKVDDPNTNAEIFESLGSLSLNIGLGYKYNLDPWSYLGVDIKYNFVDIENPMGTDLSGNILTINLIYGLYGSEYNANKLEFLDYDE